MEDDANSHSLHKLDVHFNLHLHPSKVQDLMEGVREQLNALLLRYNEDLEGVLLSYCRERLVSKQASLHPYFPYLHVTVRADVVLFRPLVGSHLVGRVNKVGEDYLGLLVLGVFNASIGAEDIRRGFKRDTQSHSWVDSADSSHRINEGSLVRFQVKHVLDQVNMFSMYGSLKEGGTGLLGHASTSGRRSRQQGATAGNKHKRRKRMVSAHKAAANGAQPAAATADGGQHADAGNGSSEKQKKKKKKRKRQDEEQQHQQQQPAVADATTPCPAKKKHKSKHKD